VHGNGVREGSPRLKSMHGQSAVRWVGEDLWWERFVEQVSFKSGMEERGSNGCVNYGSGVMMVTLTVK